MTYLCVSATDANTIYASMSNYTSGNKVYKSTNGGSTWTNISGTLPNLPANCILYQKGSPEGLYVGMDAGVYYRDNITNAWALVGTGLPNVVITELDIRYSTGKLRVSTYGRGLWETDINCVSPVVTAPTVTQPTCAVTTGTIVVNATGNATLEYSVNGGTSWQTSNTFASLAPGSYNIVVRLQVSPTCSTSYSGNPVTLVAAVPPTAYNVTGGGAYCSGGAGVPVGLSNSQSGVNYQLRLNGVNTGAPVSGTGAAISFGNQTSAGTYTVVATNPSNSCTAVMTGSVTVTVNTLPSAAIAVSETSGATNNDGTICAGASATLTASGGGTYSWSNGAATAAITVSPATTTTYTVTVTDANTCSSTATQIITVTPLPSASITVTETSGATNNDGTICSGATATLTASGGGTYSWSNGSTTAAISVSPSSTTAYTVTVTSAGCTATSSVTITVNPAPSASIAVSETSGTTNNDGTICSGASVNLTATGGGTYLWSNGATTAAITVAPSATTAYIVTVTGTGSCTATASTTITVNPQPTASIAVNETSGSNNNDASICSGASATLTASGGSTYVWNTGATTAAITVSPGSTTTYSVTVTGTGGCTATAAQTITVSATPSLSATTVEPTTCASADGSINLTVTPSGSYTFLWSNGATTEDISNVGVGTYSVTVTNTSGCTAGTSVTLSGPGGCGGGSSCPTIGSASVTPSPICAGQTVTLSAAGLANMGST
ncbi:MAG: beta strand repeat-containing protein, partial [Bacteroidota bacterium]